jgi:hypothetical protein
LALKIQEYQGVDILGTGATTREATTREATTNRSVGATLVVALFEILKLKNRSVGATLVVALFEILKLKLCPPTV